MASFEDNYQLNANTFPSKSTPSSSRPTSNVSMTSKKFFISSSPPSSPPPVVVVEPHQATTPKSQPPPPQEAGLNWETVKLSPYTNQVGGHKALLRLSESTVCKPLIHSEVHFYQEMNADLRSFVPVYLGIISCNRGSVKYRGGFSSIVEKMLKMERFGADSNSLSFPGRSTQHYAFSEATYKRNLSLTELSKLTMTSTETLLQAEPPLPPSHLDEIFTMDEHLEIEHARKTPSPTSQASLTRYFAVLGTSDPVSPTKVIVSSPLSETAQPVSSSIPVPISIPTAVLAAEKGTDSSPRDNTPSNYINPWSLQQLAKNTDADLFQEYILLEDLTAYLEHPCILDLKMGTRQHGLFSSLEKRQSQQSKVASSTSQSLGVRLCGMQIYKQATNMYYFQDKYFGRGIKTREELYLSIKAFIPIDLSKDLLPLIARLQKLRDLISKLHGYRFFASSLLLVYDGLIPSTSAHQSKSPSAVSLLSEPVNMSEGRIKVRMVDFAHCLTSQDLKDATKASYMKHHETVDPATMDEETLHKFLLEQEGERHDASDEGYIQGLRTLIEIFTQLSKEYNSFRGGLGSSASGEEKGGDNFSSFVKSTEPIKFASAREKFNSSTSSTPG